MLLQELEIPVKMPIRVYSDNKVAISISHNPIHHDRTKHVEVDRYFIKEKIEGGTITMTYIPRHSNKRLIQACFHEVSGQAGNVRVEPNLRGSVNDIA